MADAPQAQDEYDSYIGQICGMLIRQEPQYKLAEFLWWIETKHMGLAGNRAHTEQIAKRLLQLRKRIGPVNLGNRSI